MKHKVAFPCTICTKRCKQYEPMIVDVCPLFVRKEKKDEKPRTDRGDTGGRT